MSQPISVIHDDMNLYTTVDKFIIEPNNKSELMIIDRVSGNNKVQAVSNQLHGLTPTKRICGVLGAVQLISGYYLLVATHRLFVGVINGHVIWRLAGYELLPYIPTTTHLTQTQKHLNKIYLNMIRKVLDVYFFYFSYSYDLTHTLQRLQFMSPFLNNSIYERGDHRFIWNGHVLQKLYQPESKRFCLPIMLGFVSINQVNVNGISFSWSIISRRSVQRAGTRLFCRGVDENGYCANYVETEQIVEYNGQKISFVQTRGSIPLFWCQTPNLRYKPPPEIIQGKDHLSACEKHFNAQILFYGKQVVINLIDHRGAESILEKAYSNLVAEMNNPSVRYESFDFHSECRKMRWNRLNILIDRLAHEQDEFSVFHLNSNGTVLSSQDGVFRTNCIDCLDRTNVVQSMLAKRSLTKILIKLGVLSNGQNIEVSPSFEMIFKQVWTDNANLISMQYSGTGALKTDFTRTGKRTIAGLFEDAANSVTRYFLNNFNDGFREDALSLFLGNYIVNDGEGHYISSPLEMSKGWKYGTFPSILLFAVIMFLSSVIFPHEYNTENLLFLLFWGVMVVITTAGIFKYGTEFVDWPKLNLLTSTKV